MSKSKYNKSLIILYVICAVAIFVGVVMMDESKVETEYPTSEYWVAKDYHHVYEKYSGQIINVIEKNEECKMEKDTITVIATNYDLQGWGMAVLLISGIALLILIVYDNIDY